MYKEIGVLGGYGEVDVIGEYDSGERSAVLHTFELEGRKYTVYASDGEMDDIADVLIYPRGDEVRFDFDDFDVLCDDMCSGVTFSGDALEVELCECAMDTSRVGFTVWQNDGYEMTVAVNQALAQDGFLQVLGRIGWREDEMDGIAVIVRGY